MASRRDSLDVIFTRAWQAIGALVVGSAALSITAPIAPRVVGVVIGVWCIAWFAARARMRRSRNAAVRACTTALTVAIEIGAPAAFTVAVAVVAGPEVAFRAREPVLFFGLTIALSLLHLRPLRSFLCGFVGGVQSSAIALVFATSNDVAAARGAIGIACGAFAFLLARILAAFIKERSTFGSISMPRMRRPRLPTLPRIGFGKNTRLGRYKLGRVVASGDAGVVYAATYRASTGDFARKAAIHRIHDHLGRDKRFVGAFKSDVDGVAARLRHPNIVEVLDVGCAGRTWYVASEFVDGWSLDVVTRAVRAAGAVGVPQPVVAGVGNAMLAALEHAHDRAKDDAGRALHAVHRDVALENVVVSVDGVVKLGGFGIARALRTRPDRGERVGRMAPEQISGAYGDERSDLYACALVLWELLCGRRVYRGPTAGDVVRRNEASQAPAPSSVSPSLAAYDAFFARALARSPSDRFGSAAEMRAALVDVAPAVATHAVIASYLRSLPLSAGRSRSRSRTATGSGRARATSRLATAW